MGHKPRFSSHRSESHIHLAVVLEDKSLHQRGPKEAQPYLEALADQQSRSIVPSSTGHLHSDRLAQRPRRQTAVCSSPVPAPLRDSHERTALQLANQDNLDQDLGGALGNQDLQHAHFKLTIGSLPVVEVQGPAVDPVLFTLVSTHRSRGSSKPPA